MQLCLWHPSVTARATLTVLADHTLGMPLPLQAVTSWHLDEELDWHISPDSRTGAEDGGDDVGRAHKAIAHALYLRGKDWHMADVSSFRTPALYAPWVPAVPFSVVGSARQSRGIERSAVLLSNSQGAATHLDRVLDRACTLRAADAYLHQ
jgi:hypothetical protein